MENRNLNKALDIVSKLITGEEVGRKSNTMLYEEYCNNSEVYDIITETCKALNLNLYEYNDTLFISAGMKNRVFGYSNEELKRLMGLRVNKELFMVYFIIYNIITEFYKDSSSATYLEYIRIEDVIKSVDASLHGIINHDIGVTQDEEEKDSFKALALLWDELPIVSIEDKGSVRAARNSRTGYVKLTFNFLTAQALFVETNEKYYPTDRFKAMAKKYFEENKGRLYEILNREDENATD